MSLEEKRPVEFQKSSMEILSELFSSFDAEPPVIVKKEKDSSKKHKKSKKKHKHKSKKEKKSKKKAKKRKRSSCDSSTSTTPDVTDLIVKKETDDFPEKKLKLDDQTIMEDKNTLDKEEKAVDMNTMSLVSKEPTVEKNGHIQKHKKIEFASLFESTIREIKEKQDKEKLLLSDSEPSDISLGEISEKKEKHKKHRKSKRHEDKQKRKKSSRSRSRDRHKSHSHKRDRERSPKRKRSASREKRHCSKDSKDREKFKDDYKYRESKIREWDEPKYRDKEFFKKLDRDIEEIRNRRYKEDFFSRTDDNVEKWFTKDRYRGYERDRSSRDRADFKESMNQIDKKKLLEIARKNAIQMMKSGNLPGALNLGPQAQEKVIAAIKSGGKTIEELTDFCKSLSKKEEVGDLSSVSDDNGSESETDIPFHHPFQIKERPSSITMNIKNSIPLPLKSTQERVTELRMQFPVSSGQQHRKTESEWVPVSPKKTETVAAPQPALLAIPVPIDPPGPLAIEPPPLPQIQPPLPNLLPGPQVFPTQQSLQQAVDIASIVSQRLTAMRKLQENPHDVQAISEMYKAQKEMNTWVESKQQIGQFTGSTGAQILSHAELSSGYQVWARKDQLQTAAPVSGGMGMHLLQKMGWKPGEGLGKEKTGTLEPLLLEVKLDKKGIVAKEEQKITKKLIRPQKATVKNSVQGKHPVSLLGEYASKHKLGVPQYSVCFECGPDHKKNFLFKVILNGVEYKPNVVSPNKKEAKANAATVCLQHLGILPKPT